MARPTKYNQEILDKSLSYLSDYESAGDVMPSVVGLSLVLGVSRETIYDWSSQEEKKEFSDILEKINAKQHQVLMNQGLRGAFNSNIVKLALGKHGYHDKQDVTSGGKTLDTNWTVKVIASDNDTSEA